MHLYRSCHCRPTIGCHKIMKMIFAAAVVGVTLLQANASERFSQSRELEAIGRWHRAAEWFAGRAIPLRISAGHGEKSWEIGGHKHEGNVVTGQNFILEKGEPPCGGWVLVRCHAKIDGAVTGDCVLVGSDADIS